MGTFYFMYTEAEKLQIALFLVLFPDAVVKYPDKSNLG